MIKLNYEREIVMKKILSFILNEDNKLLLLKGSNKDPQFHESFWYVVTGGVEECDLSLEDTVIREVKEETNLDVYKTTYLNWIFKYTSLGNNCEEYVYMSYVKNSNVILNEESIDYKWCNIYEFVNEIKWYGKKDYLKKALNEIINENIINTETIIENV